jgi:hypothetical protein
MKKNLILLILSTFILSSCINRLDKDFIEKFESRYTVVETNRQLQQLCEDASKYELLVQIDEYFISLEIEIDSLIGVLKSYKLFDGGYVNEFNLEIKEDGINISSSDFNTVLPYNVLFVYNDVLEKVEDYRRSGRREDSAYDADVVTVTASPIAYFQNIYDNLVIPFGYDEMKEKYFNKLIEIDEWKGFSYEFNFRARGKHTIEEFFSRTRVWARDFGFFEICKF